MAAGTLAPPEIEEPEVVPDVEPASPEVPEEKEETEETEETEDLLPDLVPITAPETRSELARSSGHLEVPLEKQREPAPVPLTEEEAAFLEKRDAARLADSAVVSDVSFADPTPPTEPELAPAQKLSHVARTGSLPGPLNEDDVSTNDSSLITSGTYAFPSTLASPPTWTDMQEMFDRTPGITPHAKLNAIRDWADEFARRKGYAPNSQRKFLLDKFAAEKMALASSAFNPLVASDPPKGWLEGAVNAAKFSWYSGIKAQAASAQFRFIDPAVRALQDELMDLTPQLTEDERQHSMFRGTLAQGFSPEFESLYRLRSGGGVSISPTVDRIWDIQNKINNYARFSKLNTTIFEASDQRIRKIQLHPGFVAWQQSEGFDENVEALFDDPWGVLPSIVASGAASSAIPIAAGIAGGLAGGLAGSAFTPAGTAVGGVVGGATGAFVGGSWAETGSSFFSLADEAGVDTTSIETLREAFDKDPTLREKLLRDSATKGLTTGGVDALITLVTFGAGKVARLALPRKLITTTKGARPGIGKTSAAVGFRNPSHARAIGLSQVAAQTAGEPISDAAGSLAIGRDVTFKEMFEETLAAGGLSAIEVFSNPSVHGDHVSVRQFSDLVEKTSLRKQEMVARKMAEVQAQTEGEQRPLTPDELAEVDRNLSEEANIFAAQEIPPSDEQVSTYLQSRSRRGLIKDANTAAGAPTAAGEATSMFLRPDPVMAEVYGLKNPDQSNDTELRDRLFRFMTDTAGTRRSIRDTKIRNDNGKFQTDALAKERTRLRDVSEDSLRKDAVKKKAKEAGVDPNASKARLIDQLALISVNKDVAQRKSKREGEIRSDLRKDSPEAVYKRAYDLGFRGETDARKEATDHIVEAQLNQEFPPLFSAELSEPNKTLVAKVAENLEALDTKALNTLFKEFIHVRRSTFKTKKAKREAIALAKLGVENDPDIQRAETELAEEAARPEPAQELPVPDIPQPDTRTAPAQEVPAPDIAPDTGIVPPDVELQRRQRTLEAAALPPAVSTPTPAVPAPDVIAKEKADSALLNRYTDNASNPEVALRGQLRGVIGDKVNDMDLETSRRITLEQAAKVPDFQKFLRDGQVNANRETFQAGMIEHATRDIAGLKTSELKTIAAGLEIKGRGSMTKATLAAAIVTKAAETGKPIVKSSPAAEHSEALSDEIQKKTC